MNTDRKREFVKIYEENLDPVFRFCYFRIHDRDTAMDITQQAFYRAYKYTEGNENVENIRALVYTIAKNLIIDSYRKSKSESLDNLMEGGFEPPGDMKTDEATNTELTLRILDELSDSDKELVTLRYINNLKPKEIAEITNTRANTVSVKLKRCRERLKKIIEEKNELF